MQNSSLIPGTIVKSTGGFYYVRCEGGDAAPVECRARGIFRREGISPLCGDRVRISARGGEGTVEEILPRRNFLLRPPVANLEQLVIVASTCEPRPNRLVIDKLTAVADRKKIEPLLVVSKADLGQAGALCGDYRAAGFTAIAVSSSTGEGVEAVRQALAGRFSAFTGNSGVGKSSLLNRIDPRLGLEVGEISHKLGRGRHTTRTVELFTLASGGVVADTPGFSSVDLESLEVIFKDELQYAFREFAPYIGCCRFTGCSHVGVRDCAVAEAVEQGKIPRARYESYCTLYEQVKDLKEWELRDREKPSR